MLIKTALCNSSSVVTTCELSRDSTTGRPLLCVEILLNLALHVLPALLTHASLHSSDKHVGTTNGISCLCFVCDVRLQLTLQTNKDYTDFTKPVVLLQALQPLDY